MEEDKKPLSETGNFIHEYIRKDLGDNTQDIRTRFPPEPNGYLHIGSAKAVYINFSMAKLYGGTCNLRFDDTNPVREDTEYVDSIIEDIKWLGFNVDGRIFFASDYFDKMYECAVTLIKKGRAYVCDLTADEIREYRGTLSQPGKNSPYRGRSVEENLELFEKMKNGEFKDGEKTLRAKIDMSSPNMNMRDPVIYRISRATHHNTGDKWCIYPMYDYAHPLEDAFEEITHSLCSIEFEDHRPLYDWFINELDFKVKPRQIEFAKFHIRNTVMGKRYLRRLVESCEVDGWDDPRMVTLSGLRRRGYTPESIKNFLEQTGVSKAMSTVDYGFLEHCLREDIKLNAKVVMAVLDPIKAVITNYPEGKTEMLELENNPENEALGNRFVPFSREIYVERNDFMEDAPAKFFRLKPGGEVRLKGAYFIRCNEVIKDTDGNIIQLNCTYDEKTKSGSGFSERKVKGTIHWVSAAHALKIEARLFDSLVIDDDSEEGYHKNPDSLTVMPNAVSEPCLSDATLSNKFQFLRNGYFCLDSKSESAKPVFNRITPLKSSYKP